MGIIDGKCDSCGEEVGFLFPLIVIDELPSGGMKMVTKYYCWDCYDIMMDTAKEQLDDKDDEDKDEDEPDQPDDDTKCSCCGTIIKPDKDEDISEYFCYGCNKYICGPCSILLEGTGPHTLEDHRKACRDKGRHP